MESLTNTFRAHKKRYTNQDRNMITKLALSRYFCTGISFAPDVSLPFILCDWAGGDYFVKRRRVALMWNWNPCVLSFKLRIIRRVSDWTRKPPGLNATRDTIRCVCVCVREREWVSEVFPQNSSCSRILNVLFFIYSLFTRSDYTKSQSHVTRNRRTIARLV
jgi:hypothetical protein